LLSSQNDSIIEMPIPLIEPNSLVINLHDQPKNDRAIFSFVVCYFSLFYLFFCAFLFVCFCFSLRLGYIGSTRQTICCCEPLVISFGLSNPLQVPVQLVDLHLICKHDDSCVDPRAISSDENSHSQCTISSF